MRGGAEVIYQATFARRLAWTRRLRRPGRRALRPRSLELRALRHEARAQREASRRAPARVVRGRDRGGPGRSPERLHVVLGTARWRRTGRPMSRRTCASRSSGCAHTSSSDPRHTRGRASTARAATSCRLPRALGERRPPHAGCLDPARSDRQARHRRRHDADGPRRGAGRPSGSSPRAGDGGEAARSSGASAAPVPQRRAHVPPARARGAARARASPAPSPGDVFFDMEGDPFYDPACGLEFLFGVLWRETDGTTTYRPFWAHDRDGERRAFEEFVDSRRRAQARVSGHARLPLRDLRALDARPPDGHARHARRGDRRVPPRRGLRRPAPSRPPRDARRRRLVLAQGRREAVLHAAGRGQLGQRGGDRVRALARRP